MGMRHAYYEITNTDTGKQLYATTLAAELAFGESEFKEMVMGYLPNLVVQEVTHSYYMRHKTKETTV